MKRLLFLTALGFVLTNSVVASHLMGGEITWKCQPNGMFVFTMTLYRDCNGIPLPITPAINTLTLQSNSPVGDIFLNFVDTNDVSPVCNPSINEPHLYCGTADGDDTGSIQEHIYQSNPIAIIGVPPP